MLDDNVYNGEKKMRWGYNRGVMLGASSIDDRQKSTSGKERHGLTKEHRDNYR